MTLPAYRTRRNRTKAYLVQRPPTSIIKGMTMKRRPSRAQWFALTTLFVSAISVHAQSGGRPPARLEPTTTSATARQAFRDAVYQSQNFRPERARQRLRDALAADPQFALARVYQAVYAADLTSSARAAEITAALETMARHPTVEVLLAVYYRELYAGRQAAAIPVLRTATELLPGEPLVEYTYVVTQLTGKSNAAQVAVLQEHVKRMPDHAAAYNLLAGRLSIAGDTAAAFAAIARYAALAPVDANPEDSWSDIILVHQTPADALPHALRAIELDSTYAVGYAKLGLVQLMSGDARSARASFARGLRLTTTLTDSIEHMYWTVASHAYTGDGKSALRELNPILALAESRHLTGAVRTAHLRAAQLEAYLGDRNAVAGHLSAAAAGTSGPDATALAMRSVAFAQIGDLEALRSSAAQYEGAVPSGNVNLPLLRGMIALQSGDLSRAETQLSQAAADDLLVKALRADLLMRQGKKAEGAALKKAVQNSSIKTRQRYFLEWQNWRVSL